MIASLQPFIRAYEAHGPLFHVGPPGRQMLVLAGPEANVFLATGSDRYFSSAPFFATFVHELGTSDFIVAMDGPPHRRMRSIMKGSFTHEAIASALPTISGLTAAMVAGWGAGEQVEMVGAFRRLITDQLGIIMMDRPAGDDFPAVSDFFENLVGGAISRSRPGALSSPAYLDAKSRVFAIMREVLDRRRASGPREAPDFIDLILAATDDAGQPLAPDVLLAAALVPFFAGIDTVANSCSFMLYELLKQPALLEQLTAEADAVFARGPLDLAGVKDLLLLNATTQETLRRYPVAPAAMRYVTAPFEFAGQQVAAGQMVMFATPVAHFLPRLWPEPETFDPWRFLPPRNEHKQPGAFAPFFKGPHTCLGASLGEVQITATLATLLHHAQLTLEPADFKLKLVIDPILSAYGGYPVRVAQRLATATL